MSDRVLFPVPNALDSRKPLPIAFQPSILQFLVFLGTMVGTMVVLGLSFATDRDIWSDLLHFWLVCLVAFVVVSFHYGKHMLPYWLWTLNRLSTMRILGRMSWGLLGMRVKDDLLPGGKPRRMSVVMAASWAHVLYENTRVLENGVLDVSGIPLPRALRVIVSALRFRAMYRQFIDVGIAALSELDDPGEQARLSNVRGGFWFRFNHQASAHAFVSPLDPENVAYSAGPEEQAARDLALGKLGQQNPLMQRSNYLVVPGATVWLLNRNVKKAIAALHEHGRETRVVQSAELDRILDDEWGSRRKQILEMDYSRVRVGAKRWVSFLISRMERNIPLDWTLDLLDGSIPGARLALFQKPVLSGGPLGALNKLHWASLSWRAAKLTFGSEEFDNSIEDAERVQAEIREPSGRLHKWGIVLTVPEDQKEYAQEQLEARYVASEGGWRHASTVQDFAAKATLIGVDSHIDYASGNSQALGLSTPWAGSEIWRPSREGKARSILLGHSLTTAELVGWDIYDNTDTAAQEAWNAFVWGMMGNGKSNLLSKIARAACRPHPKHYLYEMKPRVVVIDHKPDLEYGGLIRDLDGQYLIADQWSKVADINVEQGALGINVSMIDPDQRGKFVYDIMRKVLDEVSKRPVMEPWPWLFIVDEMHMLARTKHGRWMISELGKMIRSSMGCALFGTQDMDDVMQKDESTGSGADGLVSAAIKNASLRVALRQPTLSRDMLLNRLRFSEAQCDFVTMMGGQDGGQSVASRGKCLVWAHGRVAPTQIVLLGREKEIFAKDPQDRLALAGKGANVFAYEGTSSNGRDRAGMGSLLAGRTGERARRATTYRHVGARARNLRGGSR